MKPVEANKALEDMLLACRVKEQEALLEHQETQKPEAKRLELEVTEAEAQRAEIDRLDAEAEAQRAAIAKLDAEAEAQRAEIARRTAEAEAQRAEIARRTAEAEAQQAEIDRLDAEAVAQRVEIARLDAEAAALERAQEESQYVREALAVVVGDSVAAAITGKRSDKNIRKNVKRIGRSVGL